ncbi:Meiotic coiled-coil protein 2 [Exophiala dermatitidis]
MSRKSTPTIMVREESEDVRGSSATNSHHSTSIRPPFAVLHSDKLNNMQPSKHKDKSVGMEHPESTTATGMEDILSRLKLNDSRKPTAPTENKTQQADFGTLNKLLNNLQDQNKTLKEQEKELKNALDTDTRKIVDQAPTINFRISGPGHIEMANSGASQDAPFAGQVDLAEMLRVKQELEAARSVITRQELELAETRNLKQTMDQAMGPPSEVDFGAPNDISEQTIGHLQSAFNASARPFTSRTDTWVAQEEPRAEQADVLGAGNYGRGRAIWNNPSASMTNVLATNAPAAGYTNPRDARLSGQAYNGVYGATVSPADASFQPRNFSAAAGPLGYDMRANSEMMPYNASVGMRRNAGQLRINSNITDPMAGYGSFPSAATTLTPPPISPMALPAQYSYQRGLATPITPAAPDFPTGSVHGAGNPWPLPSGAVSGQTYVTPLEPMNYRRLLDKSVSCDWKYIVDKIVCNNDQQASIFLQQKLKVGTAEQKFEIVESIVNQAYPLMINRFGNFLVQRCFEHGTPDQVVAIANAIHGNVISLSMDPFGCHVIQKAFDSVPEDHKADMVRELLRRIPDTVIHRYACHVWQKLFELRWSGEPPQIMLKVNEALRGMWHEVALGETGSLVVQNIFENCVEDEKRPAIEEVIANIDLIAHGQFGNWCIQHLCEHGSPPDKRRVIDHILANSYNYSIDQFASKVVEKCLKIGGPEFLDRYLGVITTAHPDRPRIPLIDIAGDQYGNYLIQWILMNTHHHQREQVAIHIRKHMVSLRGSKFGSRVAMLCCNPNSVTRPGPGAAVNPFGAPGQPRSQWPRFR